MKKRRIGGRTGDRAARVAGVMAHVLEDGAIPVDGPLLVVDDEDGAVVDAGERLGVPVSVWRRRAVGGRRATAWPEDGVFAAATIRLPRAWAAFEMTLHAVAARVRAGGPICAYGANDEGIKSAHRRMEPVVGEARTVDTRRHCRVIGAARPAEPAVALRPTLEDWAEAVPVLLPNGTELSLRSYPGVFAHGRLDAGTARLLPMLPEVDAGARVLDFACGAGVIAAAMRARTPGVDLTLCDIDAVALEAARVNVPDARHALGDAWDALDAGARFDLIVSNPPIHEGRDEDFRALHRLVSEAPAWLGDGGALVFVVQRTVGAGQLDASGFRRAGVIHEDPQFQVWRCET